MDVLALEKFIGYTCNIYMPIKWWEMDVHALQNFIDLLAF